MLKSKLLLITTFVVTFLLLSSQAFSQNRTVDGTVTDQSGKGIPGVSITEKGTRNISQSDANGNFRITVPESATLVFTSVGFQTVEMSVAGRTSIAASLAASNDNMSEVVVIGYGTARRRDLTGAVATVTAKDFNKGVFTSPDQLIQGKVAGVQITNNSGQPGSGSTIKIRGNSAITGSGNPLFIVDGVPIDNRSPRPGIGDIGLGGSNPGTNPLNFLNPNDIASMEILKDASATAIYGSRAAFGVVLITTKRGQSGEPRIEFGTSVGTAQVMKRIRVLDASEFRSALSYYGVSNSNDKGSDVDAFDEITRKALVQNYNVGISGGNEHARFRFSLGALNQEGIVRKTGMKKYTANLSGQFRFLQSRKIGLDVNIIPSQFSEEIAPISNNAGSRGSLIGQALRWNPTEKLILKRANGTDSLNVVRGGDLLNPLAVQEAITDRSRVTTILASISPSFRFSSWLEYRYLYSINYGTGSRRTSVQTFINFPNILDYGFARIASSELTAQSHTHTLNLNKKVASNLNLNAVVGYEFVKSTNRGADQSGFGQRQTPGGFGNFGLDYTNYIQYSDPATRGLGSYFDPTYELQSYFARTIFNFKEKYLLTATIRRDGSTRFGANRKYGNFPSFSAAWNLSREDFFPRVEQINSMRIRGGWGKTGQQEFPSGSSVGRYSFGNGGGFIQNNSFNEDLQWQADRQWNVGIDVVAFKNKLNLTVDYFNKNTSKLLFPTEPAQPAPPGGVIRWQNLDGNIKNSGLEIAINSNIIQKKDFSFDLGANISFLKNEVANLSASINTGTLDGQGITGTTVQVIRNGLPINAFFTRRFEGFDKATGLANYTENGDVLYFAGNPNPNKIVGISTSFRYKALSLTANMNGAMGHLIYNNTLNNVINTGSIATGNNIAYAEYKNPVKESFANPVTASSRFLEKGDYLKMANATLAYSIGNIKGIFRGVNVYVTGQNLFVITKFTGFDPEVNVDKNVNGVPSVGIEYIPYPSARTISLGVNFSL